MEKQSDLYFVRAEDAERPSIVRNAVDSAEGGNGKVTVSSGGKGKSGEKSDIDWSRLAMTGGGGLLGYALASQLADGLKKPGKKQSSWERLLHILLPIAAGGAGAYAGHMIGESFGPSGVGEKKAQASTVPQGTAMKEINGTPHYLVGRSKDGGKEYIPGDSLELADKIDQWGTNNGLGGTVPLSQVASRYADRQNLYSQIALGGSVGSGVLGVAPYVKSWFKPGKDSKVKPEMLHPDSSVQTAKTIADMADNASTPEAMAAATAENASLRQAIQDGFLPAGEAARRNAVELDKLRSQLIDQQARLKAAVRGRNATEISKIRAMIAETGARYSSLKSLAGKRVPITDADIRSFEERIAKNEKTLANKKPDQRLIDRAKKTLEESMSGKRKTFWNIRSALRSLGPAVLGSIGAYGLWNLSDYFGGQSSRGREFEDRINAANQ